MRRLPLHGPPAARFPLLAHRLVRSRWSGSVVFLMTVYALAMLLRALLLAR
jgi:hypothetical protein